MGRINHLQQTLPANLQDNQDTACVEFVLVDYSSPDKLEKWVKETMMTYINTGYLAYYSASGFKHFHMAHAKNIAHRLAQGEIVCNLDADNFTNRGFSQYLISIFSDSNKLIVRSAIGKSVNGRIAMRKIDFHAIGGYDERMAYGWGFEDRDFIKRAHMAGMREHLIPATSPFLTAIEHKNSERVKYAKLQNQHQSDQCHKLISMKSTGRGEFVANRGKNWGAAIVQKNFSEWITL